MENVLDRLKEELDMFGEDNLMITVKRADLERLVKAYEKLEQEIKKTPNGDEWA